MAMPELHALTGCDSTSFIHGIGKEKAYKIFEQNEVYTDAFPLLGEFEVIPPINPETLPPTKDEFFYT